MKKSDPIPQWMSIHPQGVVVRFHVQPKASRSEICGCHGEGNDVRVKIRVAAPPADGAANEALIHFLKKLAISGIAHGDLREREPFYKDIRLVS